MTRAITRAVSIPVLFVLFTATLLPQSVSAKMFPIMLEHKEHWPEEEKNKNKIDWLNYYNVHKVKATSRYPKEMEYIAENVTVIDKDDIDKFKAHSITEILNRITGVFMDMRSHDFGATSSLTIQDSNDNQVLVLVNGVKWNYVGGGNVDINTIPIGIVDRIEVIKGPASSSWGSSLGGVVNIITKTGSTRFTPEGNAAVSYGENKTIDVRAECNERFKNFGYYVHAQHMSSDGLRYDRESEMNSAYFDIAYTTPAFKKEDYDLRIGMTFGASTPESMSGKYPEWDMEAPIENDIYWGTVSLDTAITKDIDLNISLHHLDNDLEARIDTMGIDAPVQTIDVENYDETRTGASANLHYKKGSHEAVFGMDYDRESLDQSQYSPDTPVNGNWESDIDKYAVFVNDTMILGKFSVTPGLRYDYNDTTDSFVSPSIGATYLLNRKSVFRASIARGFSTPGLSNIKGGAYYLVPNEDLEHEKIWSYQAGFETVAIKYFLFKTTLFHHDVKDTMVREDVDDDGNHRYINSGESQRDGVEFEIRTSRYKNFLMTAGTAYVHTDYETQRSTNKFTYDVNLMYDDLDTFYALLTGHRIDFDFEDETGTEYDFIWDLTVSKKFLHPMSIRRAFEIFASAHNIFNGSQYDWDMNKNPKRWVEAGVRVTF